jgi:hypothetical protein
LRSKQDALESLGEGGPPQDMNDQAAFAALKRLGWQVRLSKERRPLPEPIVRRYPTIPAEVASFLERLEVCASGDETSWFLTADDYARGSSEGFGWDELERMEIEGAPPEEIAASKAFWDAHLPILLAVRGEYAYLAVVVDSASESYGSVVRGEEIEFRYTTTISQSFEAFLAKVASSRPGSAPADLDDLLLPAEDESNLESAPIGPFGRLWRRLLSLRTLESYRVCVVLEDPGAPALHLWENWSQVVPFLSGMIRRLPAEAVIRPVQIGKEGRAMPFGRLSWSEASNRQWTSRYLADPEKAGEVRFEATEIWAPSQAASLEARHGPQMLCRLVRDENDGSQGFVLAVRKDVLRQVDIAADAVIFAVRGLIGTSKSRTFDRTWNEAGRFSAAVSPNALDATSPRALFEWSKGHPNLSRPSFRWRRAHGPPRRR